MPSAPKRHRLQTLKPRLQELPPRVPLLTARPPRQKPANRTGRDADPRRTLPLNSAAWQRLRASVLAREPLCRHCKERGLLVPSTDVDHVDGNPGNDDETNHQALCHECHSRKTARDHGKQVAYGCDEHGTPLDPDHPWRQTVAALEKSPATAQRRPSTAPRAHRRSA